MMTTKVNSSAVAHNQQHSDYDDDDFHSDDVLEEQIRSSWKDLHELKESSKHKQAYVSPLDMEQLISRIAYLEDRLKRRKLQRKKKKKKNMLLMLPGSHRMRYTKDSDNDAERRIDDDTRQVVGVVPAIAMPKKRQSKRTNKAMDALLRDLDDTQQQQQDIHRDYDYHHHHHHPPNIDIDIGGVWQGKAMTSPRRQRPRSAPVIRRVRNYTPRLYSVKKALDPQEMDQQVDKKASPPPKYSENGEEYTYDLNGRRILLSQAQLAAEERRRMMEAMGAMLMLQTGEMEYGSKPRRPSSAPSSPVRYQAQYPSKSIGANVGNWLKRMGHPKSSSEQPEKPVEGHTKTQMQPRYFGAYEKMEALDLIFSVEYCHSCECHNTTTRHKAEEYFQKTSSYCQLLAEMSHQLGVSARVGVTRIKADVSNNNAGAASSRVGAFEIQVAFKSTSDRVTPTILHSKILTGHWPSKSVLEKRLRAYIAKVRVPSHSFFF
jgi:hypothetical protein